ncbi:MAG TPA: hypothetical protein VME19_16565 [Streptosporangiaceae bacterium]|nr:hypothetical protein [Streptosporangiaceae bacterium]
MNVLIIIAFAATAALTAWWLAVARSAATISRLREEMREEVGYWQAESARAKARAAQLEKEVASWSAGCKQGRDDLVTVLPLIIAALERPAGGRAEADEDHPANR